MIVKITMPGNPLPKKNSQQIAVNRTTGKPFIMQNDKVRNYERVAAWMCRKAWHDEPISRPVNVKMTFYRDSRRRVDLANLEEMTLDALVKGGVLEDDNANIVVSMDGSTVRYDKENPRTEVEISERPVSG